MIISLTITSCSAAASSAPLPVEEPSLTIANSTPSIIFVTPDESSPCPPLVIDKIPSPLLTSYPTPSALLAVDRYARTTVVALNARGLVALTEPQIIDKIQLSTTGNVLAYEVLNDINPLHNIIVATDLSTGTAWRVVPGDGCAVFGFALDTVGEQLAVLQIAMRGQFKPAAWQISVVELASSQVNTLAPQGPQKVALEPIAWSGATDEIILHAIVPFQADGAAGLWAMSADGSHLRQLLPESDYVGRPMLSPDGRLLAYFASEPEDVPREYIAGRGEPPANTLRILNLAAGEIQTLMMDRIHVFDILAWDTMGGLYLGRGAWRDNEHAFWFDEIVSLPVNYPTPEVMVHAPEKVVDLQPCVAGGLAYVTAQGQGTVVHWDKRDIEWVVENGTVKILACR